MSKRTQKNWLLILTGFLLISSGILLYFSVEQQLGFKSCAYNGINYRNGDIISDYESGGNCVCNKFGEIECLDIDDSEKDSLSDFVSTNLNFYYKFLNLLDKDVSDSSNVKISDVNMKDSKLTVVVKRESLCTKENAAPVTVGFYNFNKDILKLTTMTNRDSMYTEPCLVENKYEITSVKNEINDNFQIYFQTEEGNLFDLNICVDGNRVFSDQDVFKALEDDKVCTCNKGTIVCE